MTNLILAENKNRGWTLHHLAGELGISYIHMTSMSCGARKISGLKIEQQRKLAAYVGISMLQFYLFTGLLRSEDLHSVV